VKDLILVDPTTGERENCGVITRKRAIGDIPLWLTFDAPNRMWWIVWRDDRIRKAGYVEGRREICWEAFFEMTTTDLAKLRPS
jgi:hypothetical protein